MTRLPYLVNVPPFLIRDLNQKNLSLSKKIFLIFYGKFIGFFINRLNGKNFCLFINIFFSKDGKLIFENDRYVKIIENKNVAVYPNKRVLRVVKNFKYQLDLLYDSYLLNSIDIQNDDGEIKKLKTDYVLGFFGLIMQLGPISNWGLNIDKKTIAVDTEKFETNQKGIYAVGDICSYPGKLRLILSGFHEGALAARACFKLARPNEKYRFEFTTTSSNLLKRLGKKE